MSQAVLNIANAAVKDIRLSEEAAGACWGP